MRRRLNESRQVKLAFSDLRDNGHLLEENRRLHVENERLLAQMKALMAEIDHLRHLINVYSQPVTPYKNDDQILNAKLVLTEDSSLSVLTVTKRSAIHEKIDLFRAYFKGRDDVYAVRGKGNNGKLSYYPKRQYIGKDDGKIIWGDYLPLTNEVIRTHLQDEKTPVVIGLYPLLLDETCWFLAIDFDKSSWKYDATAFMQTCADFNVPAALERSRSGNGGHVWIFFQEPISARTARVLGTILLTRTMEKRHEIGLDSYDRMFPNQDTLPKDKKLGNLIALPLQRMAGKEGNSLFVDLQFHPYPDQWIFLSSIRKMTLSEINVIVQDAEQRGGVIGASNATTTENNGDEPWNWVTRESSHSFLGTLPDKIQIVVSNMIFIPKEDLNSSHINFLRRLAAFQNPEFYKAQAMRLSTYGKPRMIDCSEESLEYIALPRGCQDELLQILNEHGTEVDIADKRNCGSEINLVFQGTLRDEQHKSVKELLRHDIGILSATTAFGKTVVGAWMIAARAKSTLILVHRTQLMEQWRERLSVFLNIPAQEIGMIGGGKSKRIGYIDIALIQSLYTDREVKDFVKDYGHVIVDECHHISAISFEQVLKRVKAKYVLGLTATLARKDGKHPIVLMQCGPVRYKVDAKSQALKRPFTHVFIPRYTNFKLSEYESALDIQQLYGRLTLDESRNDMIFDDLLTSLEQRRSPILLTDRTAHLEYFENRLKGFAKNIIVLRGGMGKRQWKSTIEKLRAISSEEERVILATGRFVGEGFDDERLDTLFLVMPISWKGTLQQYAGRLHRMNDLKHEVQIYDYIDGHVPMFLRMYQKRLKGYQAMGYTERVTR